MLGKNVERNVTECLSSGDVQALLAGQMASNEVGRVLCHVADCQRCREMLDNSGYTDSAARSAERSSSDTGIGDAAAQQQSEHPTTEEKTHEVWPSVTRPDPGQYAFLAPSQAPDELGRLGEYRILRILGEGGMG